MARNIVWTSYFDLCADENGIRELPSGCTPHNPAQTRFIFRNAKLNGDHRLDADLFAKVASLAEAGDEAGLLALLRAETKPVGRAAEGYWL